MIDKKRERENTRIRVILLPIAAIIVLVNNYWVSSTWNGFSLNSLFINAVFVTFIISLLNPLLRKIKKSLALRPSEMLLIYMMVAVATASAGHDTVEMLTQVVGYPYWFASPENEWEDLFHKELPQWLLINDKRVMEGFYTYNETFYEDNTFKTWLRPLAFWAAFLVVMYFCMMCINIILRKQWMERERLSFPVAQISLGLIDPRISVHRNKLFWYGLSATAFLSLLNGLHRLYPVVPGPTYGKYDLTALFTEKPWNAIDAVYIEFLPFILGLAFFIPITLSFSIWFFYWFWKMEMVIGSLVGAHFLPGFPGYWTQGMGGATLMFIMFLFWARQHLWQVLKAVFRPRSSSYADDTSLYTFAVVGVVLGMIFLIAFCSYAGMATWVAVLFLGMAYVVSTVVTRVRAELGPPTHDFPFTPMSFITNIFGTKRINNSSLTQFAVFKFVDYGNRSSAMPHMLESFYIKNKLRTRQTGLFITAMVIAIILGTSVGLIGNVQRGYRYTGQTWVGDWAFPDVANQIKYPSGTNYLYIAYLLAGGGITLALAILSRYFIWWPFHPLGYIMGGEWMLRYLWFSIFIAWLIKWTILKFGGLETHRKAVPFFIGVTVGDAVSLAIWRLYGVIFNKWTLDTFYW